MQPRLVDTPTPASDGQTMATAPADHGSSRPRTWEVRLRGELVTGRLHRADTMLRRMRGLLGRGSLDADEGMWIEPCNAIHMFFMRFPIDAVFLDKDLQVVKVCEDLAPWRMARGGRFAHSVLELPQGKAAFFNMRVGDRLQLDPVTG